MKELCIATFRGLVSVLYLYPSFANAQVNGLDLDDPAIQAAIRVRYVGSPDLPDGIAYISTIRSTVSLNSSDPDTAEALVMDRMGFDTGESRRFISLLSKSLDEFNAKVASRGHEIACDKSVPRAFGNDAFAVLDAIEDESDAMADGHFSDMKNSLDDETAARLQNWITASKRGISHTRFDQKKLATNSGIHNVDAEMSALCASLEKAIGGQKE